VTIRIFDQPEAVTDTPDVPSRYTYRVGSRVLFVNYVASEYRVQVA
jgi:hypothetical protein